METRKMAMWKIGCAALAWTFGVCAALSTPAIAGGGGPEDPVYRALSVSGGDMTRNADEAYTGVYYAFNGDLSREGFIVRLFGTRGFYDYSNGIDNDGNYWHGDLMIGYQWVRGRVDIGVYVGVDYQNYNIAVPDPANKLNGDETGFKVLFDLESNDRSSTPWYVALNGSYSTAFDTYYALGRVGYNFGRFILGPEAWALGDVTGDGQRLGAFIQFEVPTGTLALSAGHQFGDDNIVGKGFDNGAYGTVSFRIPMGR
jgi:Cellulose biosynthesis protein BcsS